MVNGRFSVLALPGYPVEDGFLSGRDLEVYAAIVVGFFGRFQVKICQLDLAGAAVFEIEKRVADDGVVENVGLVTVLENKNGGRLGDDRFVGNFGHGLRGIAASGGWCERWCNAGVGIGRVVIRLWSVGNVDGLRDAHDDGTVVLVVAMVVGGRRSGSQRIKER